MRAVDGLIQQLRAENEQLRQRLRQLEGNAWAVPLPERGEAGIVQLDGAGVIRFVNAGFCTLSGYSETELVGCMAWHDLVVIDPAEPGGGATGATGQRLETPAELQLRRNNGTLVRLQISPVDRGEPNRVLAVVEWARPPAESDLGGAITRGVDETVVAVDAPQWTLRCGCSDCKELPGEASISAGPGHAGSLQATATLDIRAPWQTESILPNPMVLCDQLAKIAAIVPGVICSFRLRPDGSACMPYASHAFEQVYGLPAEAVATDFTPVFERIHPQDRGHIDATIAESARGMTAWQDTFRYCHPKRGEIWLEGHSMPEREADGSILWHGFIQEISERRLREEEIVTLNRNLQRRLDEMQAVFDTVPIGLAIAEDAEGSHIRGNPANERQLGLTPGAELSLRSSGRQSYRIYRDGRELGLEELPMQRAARGEAVTGQVFEVLRGDGRRLHMLCNAATLFDENGLPRGAVGAFMDITPLQRAEQALSASEGFKQAVLDALPATIAVLDERGIIRAVNQPWLRFGTEHRAPGLSAVGIGADYLAACATASGPDDSYARAALSGIRTVLEGKQRYFEMEYPCNLEVGEQWFLMQVVQPATEVGGALVVHLDVSTRKQAELALQEREERLRLAVNAARLATWDWYIQTGTVIWNDEHYRMLGYRPGSVKPSYKAWASRVHPPDLAIAESRIRQAMAQGGDYAAQFRTDWPNGEQRWIDVLGQFTFDSQGRPVRSYGVMMDVTNRVLANQALRENEARLRLALAATAAGLWDRNLSTGEVFFSAEWKRQLGYREEELANHWQTWEERLHPDDRQMVLKATADFVQRRAASYELDYRLRHRDGSYRWIHSRGALLGGDKGNPGRMLGLNLDITEHKKEQGLRNRRGKLEELFRHYVAAQTASAIAHELHQPLTAIAYYAETALLLTRSDRPDAPALAQLLEKMAQQAQRAGQVTRQLLNLLQKGEADSEAVDLGEVIFEAVDLIKGEDEFSDIELVVRLDPALPPVQANRLQVEKVLINLLHNGAEAMQERSGASGVIRIAAMPVDKPPASMAQVTVSDSGRGQENVDLEQMFKPFFTTKSSGLGMGLAISRALVESYGGRLWAERNADRGLSVHFTLPPALERQKGPIEYSESKAP